MKSSPYSIVTRKFIYLSLILIATACQNDNHHEQTYVELKKAYHTKFNEVREKFMTATAEEQPELIKELPDKFAYNDTLLSFTSKYPKADFIPEVWVELLLQNLTVGGSDVKVKNMAIAEITKNHAHSEDLSIIHPQMLSISKSENMDQMIQAVLEKNKSEKVLGIFNLAFAKYYVSNRDTTKIDHNKALPYLETVLQNYKDIEIPSLDKSYTETLGDIALATKNSISSITVGQKMPSFDFTDLEGNKRKLSDFKGKVVLLDVWATWCGPCIQMIPHQREMIKKLSDQPFELISVSVDKELETVRKFQDREPMPWINWHNGDKGGALTDWGITKYPTIFILDKEGIIRHRLHGGQKGEDIDRFVNELL